MAHTVYVVGVSVVVIAFVIHTIANHIRVARFKKNHGCKPERRLPQLERIMGYGLYRIQSNAAKNKTLLEVGRQRYLDNGPTWSAALMGEVSVFYILVRGFY
jgi:hypothetical protein